MKCPHQNSMVPPCKIEAHPQRENIEYCKVCGEWRYLSEIGNDLPNLLWMLISVSIIAMLIVAMMKEDPMFRRYEQQQNYIGRSAQ